MRVAVVCPYDLRLPGGVQSHVRALAAALRQLGDEVVVVAPGAVGGAAADRDWPDDDAAAGSAPDGAAADGARPDGAATGGAMARPGPAGERDVGGAVAIPFNGSRAPVALAPASAARTRAALADVAPDVVHVHEPLVPLVSLTALLRPRAPTVATFHTVSDRARLYRTAGRAARRAVARLAGRIAVSDAARRYHAAALHLPEASFRVVPNGVEVARFAAAEPLPELLHRDVPTLLFVGRLERRKGLQQLVAAYALLRSRRPALRLLVLGDGPERDRCWQLLPARLRADVVFLGRVAEADKPAVIAAADVFVAPALGGESFGIVLLEAMAAGVPVVASAIEGYVSLVTDGVNGRLVPPGDARELAAAIGALIDNSSLGAAMAKEARQTAAQHDWSVVAAEVRDTYARALAGAGAPGAP